jgi:hypothetical protein
MLDNIDLFLAGVLACLVLISAGAEAVLPMQSPATLVGTRPTASLRPAGAQP